ncbi:MAG TPA: ankyrin repeat domain-containing protein [Terriglobales bacterium]|nr:ankyrin repeat domain-containing protein [Terriglobales bacterium]
MKALFGFLLFACLLAPLAVSQTEKLERQGKFHGGSEADHQLWYASYDGKTDEVISSVEHGADVNFRGKGDFSPIVIAARNGHLDIVKFLVEHGARVDQRDNNRKKSALLAAAFKGHYDVVQYVVEKGADLDVQAVNGWTPLHDAAYIGNFQIVKLLVDRGARLDLRNERNETALQTAERGQHDAVRRRQTNATPEEYRQVIDYLRGHQQ